MNKIINYIVYSLLFLLIPFSFVRALSSSRDSVLAKVENYVITIRNFENVYVNARKQLGINDNLSNRTKILNEIINDYILINYGRQKGYADDQEAKFELNRIRIQELLNQYSDNFISPKVSVNQDDLIETYHRMNTKVKVSHIYSSTKSEIDSIYQSLLDGADFETIAASSFTDPELRRNKGLIGYITFDEMDPVFEDEAYSLMIGGISKPIKTAYGYSIIRVEDKITSPIITEDDFIKRQNEIYPYAKKKKYEKFIKNFIDTLSKKLIIGFNESVIIEFYKEIFKSKELFELIFIENKNIPSSIENKSIVETINGSWSVKKLLSVARYISDTQKQFIRNKENLKESISGLVVRDYLIDEARRNNLDRSDIYYSNVNKKFEEFIIQRVTEKIKDEIKIRQNEIEDYYNSNIQNYKQPKQVRLSSILLGDSTIAFEVKKLLDEGENFGALAEKYSLQVKTAAQNGDMGFFNKNDLNEIDCSIAEIKINDVKGPIINEDKFLFIKCTEEMGSLIIPIESIKDKLIEEIRGMKFQEQKKNFIKEYSKNLKVDVNNEKLKTLKIND